MNLPTADEIQAAHEDVDAEGAQSETTIGLAQLAMTDPYLKAFVDNVCDGIVSAGVDMHKGSDDVLLRATVVGTLIGGLNLGIRIGEMREPADPGADPDHDPED